jgi:hypothetical protein
MTAPTPRRTRRLVAVIAAIPVILLTVAAARLIAITTPIRDDYTRPWVHQGQMNETIVADDFAVMVLDIRGGRAYEGFSNPVTTDGLFLLVRARVMALDTRAGVGYAELVDPAGNAYKSIWQSESLLVQQIDPAITIEGELLFEVPPAAATELRLRLTSDTVAQPRYGVVVEVPLTIDPDDLDAWYHRAAPLTVLEPEVVG